MDLLYTSSQCIYHVVYRSCSTNISQLELVTQYCFSFSQANVLQAYEALEKIVVHYYSTSDQFIISAPTQDQV